jgi:hypothetical protein
MLFSVQEFFLSWPNAEFGVSGVSYVIHYLGPITMLCASSPLVLVYDSDFLY